METKTTFVSAYVSNVNQYRSMSQYFEYGKEYIQLDVPKILFLEETSYSHFLTLYNLADLPAHTKVICVSKKDVYLYEYEGELSNFHVHTDNPGKDTLDYMMTIASKTEWVRKAIELNPFQTTQFIWVDFGVYHMIKNQETYYRAFASMASKFYTNVRIARIWDLDRSLEMKPNYDLYKKIAWYFAGCVFGGHRDALIEFADKMKRKCIEIMNEKKTLMWEVNIWYMVWEECPELFQGYQCNHDPTVLTNY